MKFILEYEDHSPYSGGEGPLKNYGQPYALNLLRRGDRVTYLGMPSTVEEVNDYVVSLKIIGKEDIVNLNQNMFNQKAYVPRK